MRQREHACATKIQAAYRGQLVREQYELLRLNKARYAGKIKFYQGHRALRTSVSSYPNIYTVQPYALMVLFETATHDLQFIAYDIQNHRRLCTTYEVPSSALDTNSSLTSESNHHLLERIFSSLSRRLYVSDRQLCIDSGSSLYLIALLK